MIVCYIILVAGAICMHPLRDTCGRQYKYVNKYNQPK